MKVVPLTWPVDRNPSLLELNANSGLKGER